MKSGLRMLFKIDAPKGYGLLRRRTAHWPFVGLPNSCLIKGALGFLNFSQQLPSNGSQITAGESHWQKIQNPENSGFQLPTLGKTAVESQQKPA